MSRIGKRPVAMPSGVTADIQDGTLTVKGPKGTLSMGLADDIKYEIGDGGISVQPANDSSRAQSFWGMQRTLVANLVGGWLIMWLVVLAFPSLHADLVESATHFATAPVNGETISLAVLAGAVMTLLTRMQRGTDDMTAKIVAAVVAAFLLAGTQMFHSILDSLLIFGALHTGDATFGYAEWARFLALAVVGNVVGGLGLVTVLRLLRSKDRIVDEREEREEESA